MKFCYFLIISNFPTKVNIENDGNLYSFSDYAPINVNIPDNHLDNISGIRTRAIEIILIFKIHFGWEKNIHQNIAITWSLSYS